MGGAGGRSRVMLAAGIAVTAVAVGVLLYAATRSDGDGTSPETTTSTAPALLGGRMPLPGFGEVLVTVTGDDGDTCQACLLVADTQQLRAQGLMGVTDPDLGGYDGMLFRYDRPVDGAFWMRDTPMPLSIAHYDADGAFVSAVDMEPCADETSDQGCRRYRADGPFMFAVEVPQGGLGDLLMTEGSSLSVQDEPCPLQLRR